MELFNLGAKVRCNAPNLLDHCLVEDLDLNADFNGCYLPSRDFESGFWDSLGIRDAFSECSVTTPCRNATASILAV